MFTLGISALIAAYVLIALLLLSINLYSNWSWPIKAGAIIITSIFYIVSYYSFPPLLGWPTKQSPPQRFRLIAAHVEQPNKLTGYDGAIYLWLTEIEDLSSTAQPRAYEFPYTDPLHEIVLKANSKLNKNILQLGEYKEPDETFLKNIEQKTRTSQVSTQLQFYDLPDPLFPEK